MILGQDMLFNGRRFLKVAKELKSHEVREEGRWSCEGDPEEVGLGEEEDGVKIPIIM